ncbi:RuvC-like resolvase [Gordonia phage Lilbeanie]|uniref:RuvC-like resolvase n=1 Tax=Gordonia phage Lilbeanie TaxID=2794947 RepID=A0A7T1KSB1_9CAUD|nr:RuvC-like resolvase [Gordonia phage Lilbeanie]QPO17144.1 RuvC-like resolvase [Gordonia phage Lilbeanie]
MWLGTILGIDPSLTGTGLARIQIHGHHTDLGPEAIDVTTATFGTDPHKCVASCGDADHRPVRIVDSRHRKILKWLGAALDSRPELVVIEYPILMRQMGAGAQIERIGLFWRIVGQAHQRGIPVVPVVPAQIKKAVTDNGAAGKPLVAEHLDRLYRDVPLRIATHDGMPRYRTDDEYDALGAATMGAVRVAHRQLPIRVTEHMLTVTNSVDWPTIPSKTRAGMA